MNAPRISSDKNSAAANRGVVFFDTSSNFHPYECDGPKKCVHCARAVTEKHDPKTCGLCDPDYDGGPSV